MIIEEADRYIPITIRPNFLTVSHVTNFRLKNMKAVFDPKSIHVGFVVEIVALGQVLFR